MRDVVTRQVEDGKLGEVTYLVREPEGKSVQENVSKRKLMDYDKYNGN